MLVKAFLTQKNKPWLIVPFLFNPAELTVSRSNTFSNTQTGNWPGYMLQFSNHEARTVTMDLFFDTYEEGIDVRIFTDRITGWDGGSMFGELPSMMKGLMDKEPALHAPPICLFVWGTFIFQCAIETVTKTFTMFSSLGFPLRATLNVTLKECRPIREVVKENSNESSDITKGWTVKSGDSLWSIAKAEYGTPDDWRLIASANHIDNPRLLEPGKNLILPVKE